MRKGLGGGKRWGLAALAMLFAACHQPDRIRQVEATAIFDISTLDFGDVPVGEWVEKEVDIQNAGYVPFTAIEALRLQDNPSFQVELVGDGKVGSGQRRAVRVRFHPLHEGAIGDELNVTTDAEHKPKDPLHLRGRGAPTRIKIDPPLLDYETLEVDSDRSLSVTVENPVDLPLTLKVGGRSADQFDTQTITLPPHAKQEVSARYFPHALGQSDAQLEIRSCPDCTPTAVGLTGRSVKSALVFDPAPVPFDEIPVHETTRSFTRATNITWRPVKLSQINTSDVAFSPVTQVADQEIAPGATLRLDMQFAARTSGPAVGTMAVAYQSDKPRQTEVMLDARGGRPQIALTPVSLDFGDLPVGGKAEKVVRISNAGTTGNLHFQGVKGTAAADLFSVSAPFRGKQTYPYSGGTWPSYTSPNLDLAPGSDYLDVKVYFEPTSAGDFTGTITFLSDDLFNPERSITVTGRAHSAGPCTYRVLPQGSIDFGNVQVGRGAVLGFRFENTGGTECAVKNIHLSDDAKGVFWMPGGDLTGGSVLPNTAFSAQVAFKAPVQGSYHGQLEIQVNDPNNPIVHLPLNGVALDTCLTAAPTFVDFGAIRYDCATETRRTYVSNQCSWPVDVSGVWLGAGTGNEFALVNPPPVPQHLDPGQGFELELSFARQSLGQHYNPLFIQAAGEQVPLLVPVLGETNHEGLEIERFVQGTDSQLDVLFVVSNSTTMQPYQERLQQAIPGWLERVRTAGVDMQVGVTSTGLAPRGQQCGGGANGGEDGRLFPVDGSRPRVVNNLTGSAADLQANLGVGICHNLVQGLEASRQALTSPLVDHADDPRTQLGNDGNLGFLRAPARLAVVYLADEDDHSGFEPISYIQLLQALKGPGSSQRTSAYAIVPTDASCETAGPPGPRFAQVAKSTGGQVLNVCSGDYSGLLDHLAQRAAGAQRDFRLAQTPVDPSGITVKVDGKTLLQGAGNWTYDAASNAVVFDEAAVPQSGQAVEVRYRSVCSAPAPM